MAGAAVRCFWFLRWCSEWSCSKRRRPLPAETVSTSTKMDPESDIEDGLTTHSNCMQYGLDAAGNTDQPTTSTKIIQLDNDESGADRQNKLEGSMATMIPTLPGQQNCSPMSSAGNQESSGDRRRPHSLSRLSRKHRGIRAAIRSRNVAALIPNLKQILRNG